MVGQNGQIVHSDGFQVGEMSRSICSYSIRAMWGLSATDVYVAGSSYACPGVYHYDGTHWLPMDVPIYNTGSGFRSVWASAPDDVYVLRYHDIWHFDGFDWVEVLDKDRNAIWGSSASDVFAVGNNGRISHFDGASWQTMDSSTTQNLSAVWGAAENDVYAVGDGGAILHFDGNDWSQQSVPEFNFLTDVWGCSSTEVFAVGRGTNDNVIALHFDGSSWSFLPDLPTDDLVENVWASSSTDIYAVGQDGVLHFDGDSWSRVDVGTGVDMFAVWGSSATDVFVAGDGGAILHYGEQP